MKKLFNFIAESETSYKFLTFDSEKQEQHPQSVKLLKTTMPDDIKISMDEWMNGGYAIYLNGKKQII